MTEPLSGLLHKISVSELNVVDGGVTKKTCIVSAGTGQNPNGSIAVAIKSTWAEATSVVEGVYIGANEDGLSNMPNPVVVHSMPDAEPPMTAFRLSGVCPQPLVSPVKVSSGCAWIKIEISTLSGQAGKGAASNVNRNP